MRSPNISISNRIGELFISGFKGDVAPDDILRQIEMHSLGGVVLFAENCIDHEKLMRCIEKLQAHSDNPLFIAIDQEGGRVCRLKGKPAEYYSAESYGKAAEQSPAALKDALGHYHSDFELAAEYMSSLGINLLLGPVCDLRPSDEILSEATALDQRTFSASADVISAFVKETVEIAHQHNMISCLKHAPGLGSVKADPHYTLGASELDDSEFRSNQLAPFRAGLRAGAGMIMTSHFLIPKLDTLPVTYSSTIVEKLLRETLLSEMLLKENISNQCPLITDDMDMGALKEFAGAGDPCLTAFKAGHDILLARSNERVVNGITAIKQGFESGEIAEARLLDALSRIDLLRETLERVS